VDRSEKLKQTLAELHAELSGAKKVDPDTRQLLKEALAEIQEALSAAETTSAAERAATGGDDGIGQRLQTAAAKFEATHPTLSGLLKRLTDLLGAAGI
jgi:dsDNA-specific endonuclease/ATPase MutS2